MRDIAPDAGTMDALLHGRLGDPFSVLGHHRGPKGTLIRTFQRSVPPSNTTLLVPKAAEATASTAPPCRRVTPL